jgi:hypothetical protein
MGNGYVVNQNQRAVGHWMRFTKNAFNISKELENGDWELCLDGKVGGLAKNVGEKELCLNIGKMTIL